MEDRTAHLTAELPDRYELVRGLGRGGMAAVYLAVDRKHERQVALKVLSPELVSGIAAERFVREIDLAARLTHPHILPLLDSGLVDGRPYYVMPYVDGESLRERLDRAGALPLEEALRIARDVGKALAAAHDSGVIHRDIKPGNILLTPDAAVVTDFGIATALEREPEDHLTRPGHSLGTPGYMSPEQAAGDGDVAQRSDQYALGCVLFEMLTGDPPFSGRNLRAILGRQLSQPVPDASALRDTVPRALDDVLRTALARNPADRYRDVRAFVRALEGAETWPAGRNAADGVGDGPSVLSYVRPAAWVALAAVALVAGASWLGPGLGVLGAGAVDEAPADTMRVAIFPFDYGAGTDSVPLETLLHDALNRWDEINVVDAFEVGEAVARSGRDELDEEAAARVALAEGAGRFVLARVTSLGDSLWIRAGLFEARHDEARRLGTSAIRSPGTLAGADAALARLAAELLFRTPPAEGDAAGAGTSSLQAFQAFDFGQRAVEEWRLARADSGFWAAARHDPEFARAHLWVALTRAWQEEDRAAWAPAARRAQLGAERLSPRDAGMAQAIRLQAEDRAPEACRRWRSLTEEHEDDFAVWYGLAHCLSEDTIVVRDPASPTGWAFRTSYHSAIEAYEEAFTRLPSMLETFHRDSYRALREILLVSGSLLRDGVATSEERDRFWAYPLWQGDTLAYVPAEGPEALFGRPEDRPRTAAAIRNMRERFRDVAVTWVAEAPASARAREALAYGLMMNGDAGALDTLVRARTMAADGDESFDLARSEVWVRLVLALPGDPEGLRRVRTLADSLLENASTELDRHPAAAAGLAALVGRANLAAAYARRASRDQDPRLLAPGSALMQQTLSDGQALHAFAALGGPTDSVARLERQIEEGIRTVVPAEQRRSERSHWLIRPATLMFPDHRFSSEADLAFDPVVAAQRALAAGDTSAVRDSLETFAGYRRTSLPFARTLDTQLPEMRLLLGIGDLEGALDWVEPTLSVLPRVDLERLSHPESVGPLLRITALRAEVAGALGRKDEAGRWARAVTILWSDGDPFLRDRLDALRSLIE